MLTQNGEAYPSEARLIRLNRILPIWEPYAITIKKLGPSHLVTTDSYHKFFHFLTNFSNDVYFIKEDQWMEMDPHRKIHCHGTLMIRKGFLRKKICCRGYHVKLVLIDDINGWKSYCRKNQEGKHNLKDYYAFIKYNVASSET